MQHHLVAIASLCGVLLLATGDEPTPDGSKPLQPVAAR